MLPSPPPLSSSSSGAVRYLMNVPGKAGQDVLLVSSEACMLLDGQDLVPKWTLGATQVLRYVQLLLSARLLRTSACPADWQGGCTVDWKVCVILLEASLLSSDLSFVTGGASEAAGHKY